MSNTRLRLPSATSGGGGDGEPQRQLSRKSWVPTFSVFTSSRPKSKELRRNNSRALFEEASKAPAIGGCVDVNEPHSEYLLPPEVALFEPTSDEIYQGSPSAATRQIFLNTPLSSEEVASLKALHEVLRNEALVTEQGDEDFPVYVALHALRLLQQRKFHAKKTVDLILVHLSERVQRLPIAEKDVLGDLAKGFMYWHGRDRKCRPCLVIRIENMGDMNRNRERAVRLVIFVLEYALRYALVPGRVENWVVLLDLANATKVVSMFHLAGLAATAKMIATTLESVYCGRMTWMKILNMPAVMQKIVESCIPSEKKKKVQIVANIKDELAQFFEPNQVEARYGGTAPDLSPAETYPFHFFPGATPGSAATPSLHTLTHRAFHEGRLWDTSLPDKSRLWMAEMKSASLTPASAAALAEMPGGTLVTPCCDLKHLTSILREGDHPALGSGEPSKDPEKYSDCDVRDLISL